MENPWQEVKKREMYARMQSNMTLTQSEHDKENMSVADVKATSTKLFVE